jgi:hypothetical protein
MCATVSWGAHESFMHPIFVLKWVWQRLRVPAALHPALDWPSNLRWQPRRLHRSQRHKQLAIPWSLQRPPLVLETGGQPRHRTRGVLSPPPPFVLRVFSSRTGQWDERLIERETHGLPTMGTVAGIREQESGETIVLRAVRLLQRLLPGKAVRAMPERLCNEVITRSIGYSYRTTNEYSLCFPFLNLFLPLSKLISFSRINTSSGTYHLLKRPMGIDASKNIQFYLGKSKDGVYYAVVDYECQLQVCYLDESHSQLKWVLKCDTCLCSVLPPRRRYRACTNGPWCFAVLWRQQRYTYCRRNSGTGVGVELWHGGYSVWGRWTSLQSWIPYVPWIPSLWGGCLLASIMS